MSNDGLIIQNMHLSHIHLAVTKYIKILITFQVDMIKICFLNELNFPFFRLDTRQYVLKCTFSRNLDKYLVSISFAQIQLLQKLRLKLNNYSRVFLQRQIWIVYYYVRS